MKTTRNNCWWTHRPNACLLTRAQTHLHHMIMRTKKGAIMLSWVFYKVVDVHVNWNPPIGVNPWSDLKATSIGSKPCLWVEPKRRKYNKLLLLEFIIFYFLFSTIHSLSKRKKKVFSFYFIFIFGSSHASKTRTSSMINLKVSRRDNLTTIQLLVLFIFGLRTKGFNN